MFKIDKNNNISITRGDKATINLQVFQNDGSAYEFSTSDKIIFTVKDDYANPEYFIRKIITFTEPATSCTISLDSEDTTTETLINDPLNYVYDIALNEDMTIIGYDSKGPKYFNILPEASNDE